MAQLFITTGQSTMLFVLLVFSVSLFDGLAKENLSGQLAQPQPNNFRVSQFIIFFPSFFLHISHDLILHFFCVAN
jgi:hypothetical protein